jgi:dTDP-L-rhamnose 4-epimerase
MTSLVQSPASHPRHVLVTGGAGFIGSHIVDDLVAGGVEVTVLDNLDPAAHAWEPTYLNSGARYVWADVRSREGWDIALDGCSQPVDAVSHQAGKVGLGVDFADVEEYVTNNDTGMAVGLRALHDRVRQGSASGVTTAQRFVLASSMVVYGEGRYRCGEHGVIVPGPRRVDALDAGVFDPPCPLCGSVLSAEEIPEDAPMWPRNVYAATKLHQEHLLDAFVREHPVSAVALRYHNVYGPRMPRSTPYAGVASIFRSALADGRAPMVTEDGGQRRNFVHVRDVAAANLAALRSEFPPGDMRAYNVASTQSRTVGEMAEALATAFGVKPGDDLWPKVTGAYRLGDVRHVFASTAKAAAELGYRSAIGFSDGMTEFSTAELRAAPVLRSTGSSSTP